MRFLPLLTKPQAKDFLVKILSGKKDGEAKRLTLLFVKSQWLLAMMAVLSCFRVLESCVKMLNRDHAAGGHRADNNGAKTTASIVATFLGDVLDEVALIRKKNSDGNQLSTGTKAIKFMLKATDVLTGGSKGRIVLSHSTMPKLAALFDVYTEAMQNKWLVEMQELFLEHGYANNVTIEELGNTLLTQATAAIPIFGRTMGGDPETPLALGEVEAAGSSTALVVSTPDQPQTIDLAHGSVNFGNLFDDLMPRNLPAGSVVSGGALVVAGVPGSPGGPSTPSVMPAVLAGLLLSATKQSQQQQQKQHDEVVGMLGEMREHNTQQHGTTAQKLDYGASKLDDLQGTANGLTKSVAVANLALKEQEAKLVNLLESAEAADKTLTSLQASAADAAARAAKDRKEKAKRRQSAAKLAFEDAEAAERKEAADQAMLIASERGRKAAQAAQLAKVTTKLSAVEAHVSNVVSAAAAELTAALKKDGEEIAEGIVGDIETTLKLGARKEAATLGEKLETAAEKIVDSIAGGLAPVLARVGTHAEEAAAAAVATAAAVAAIAAAPQPQPVAGVVVTGTPAPRTSPRTSRASRRRATSSAAAAATTRTPTRSTSTPSRSASRSATRPTARASSAPRARRAPPPRERASASAHQRTSTPTHQHTCGERRPGRPHAAARASSRERLISQRRDRRVGGTRSASPANQRCEREARGREECPEHRKRAFMRAGPCEAVPV